MKRITVLFLLVAGALFAGLLAAHFASAVGNEPGPTQGEFDPALGHNRADHFVQTLADGQWSLTSFTNDLGEVCSGITVPGHGLGVGCIDAAAEFSASPLVVHAGSSQSPGGDSRRWHNYWVWGHAQTSVVNKLQLTLTDCTRVPLPMDGGYFLYVFSPSQIDQNVGPQSVTALAADGSAITTQAATIDPPGSPNGPITGAVAPVASAC